MSLVAPDIRTSVAASVNPVTKLFVALLIAMTLVLSIDVVSAGVACVLVAVLLPLSGLRARELVLRTAPIWLSAALAGITTALYGQDAGATLLPLGPVTITEGSVLLAAAIALRVIAIGVPGIVLFATTDPTDLADGFGQLLHLPARFVLGGLAGLRLVGLLVDDWHALAQARRARGVADRGALRRFASQAFALLVIAVRRGSKLATAMEARGFGSDVRRTWARPSRLGRADLVLAGIGILVTGAAVAAAMFAGTWNFVLG
ncbi:MAG TPA: energy-coupling factor transporter transmembrane component T [Pseudolysinimonas sp.]|nr:energy-coupling factor transporter transmembrane component T [Pseudolysinimonas sp.]